MAKQIRECWVWKKQNRWWRYLPRRDDARPKIDLDELGDQCATFTDPMPAEPPKLWVAWLYKDFEGKGSVELRDQVRKLFGKDAKPGEMKMFKNTLSTNKQLWKIKHLLEIRPVSFPDGEPELKDIFHLEVMADGRCVIDRSLPNPENVQLINPSKQFTQSYLVSRLKTKDIRHEDVFEDTVYNPQNITIC